MKLGYRQCGYTLVEVLLVTAVTLLIASATVVSFAPLMQQVSFEEGANRFESLLRFARAEAANSGHKIQIQFEAAGQTNAAKTGLKPVIVMEEDPFNCPGQFLSRPELSWMDDHVSDLISVESIRSLDPPEPVLESIDPPAFMEEAGTATNSETPSSITFYPDGSSDSAEFVLAPTDENDARRVQVRLVGLTGEISRRSVASDNDLESEEEPVDKEDLPE